MRRIPSIAATAALAAVAAATAAAAPPLPRDVVPTSAGDLGIEVRVRPLR